MPGADPRPAVLFLCTANSCRSQMAEGWARTLHPDRLRAFSAGVRPGVLNPLAVRVMRESGVDISAHAPKHPDDVGVPLDLVVTVCDDAREACPVLPGVRTLHAPFDDPPRLARDARTEDDALAHYRRVRDEIRSFVQSLPNHLTPPRTGAGDQP